MKTWVPTAVLLMALTNGVAAQDGGSVMIDALATRCLDKLETGVFNGEGLERGTPNMETALLNGKTGRVWRTADPRVVVVDFESDGACDIMGLQVSPVEFSIALLDWHSKGGTAFTLSGEPMLSQVDPDGLYMVRQTEKGDYVQFNVTSNPEHNFVGIAVTRVDDSFAAREVLGE